MNATTNVLFGLNLVNAVQDVPQLLTQAAFADEAGLDFLGISDHPFFADRIDAYSALGYVLGATKNISAGAIVTNLLSRTAPIVARSVAGLSTLSGERVVLGLGAGGLWEEIVGLGAPELSGGGRIRALEEAIVLVKALTGGGDPVTYDGEVYHVTDLAPSSAPTPPIWVGVGGPKGLGVVGRHADGWIPPHAADWRSATVAEARPIIDDAAVAAGRSPADIGNVYLVAGQITPESQRETRNERGRWNGGGIAQWVEELTYAVLEGGASAFLYVIPPGERVDYPTLSRWAEEVAPAVREAVGVH